MSPTETGWRCDPCTEALSSPEPVAIRQAECTGCEYNDPKAEEGCSVADAAKDCPIMASMPKDAPHRGPLTAAEETRGRACGELAAGLIAQGCPHCKDRAVHWEALLDTPRIAIHWWCGQCAHGAVIRLTREGCYRLEVTGDALHVTRDGHQAVYRISTLGAVARSIYPDHDVITFRAGGETQTFSVEDASEAIPAIVDRWSAKP